MAHSCHLPVKCLRRKLCDRHSTDRNTAALFWTVFPHHKRCDRTFSTTRFTDQRDKTPARHGEIHIAQHRGIQCVSKVHMGKTDLIALRFLHSSRLWYRRVQKPENLVRSGISIHRNMKEGAEQTQRKEKLRRDHNDKKALRKRDRTRPVFKHA